MDLKPYFEKVISNDRVNGSWLITGHDPDSKLKEILEVVSSLSSWEDVLILSDLEKLDQEIREKFSVYEPGKNESQTGIGIKAAKEAISFLGLSTKGYRVLIINRAEDLNLLAQNTLLKIVEEPYEKSVIFFLAQTEEGLLPTLVSRMRKVKYRLVDYKKYFEDRVSKEELSFFKDPEKNLDFLKKMFLVSDEEKIKFMENIIIWGRDQVLNKMNLENFQILSDNKKRENKFNSDSLRHILKILARMKHPAMNHRLQLESLFFKIF